MDTKMTRRGLFKKIGAALLIAPVLPLVKAAEALGHPYLPGLKGFRVWTLPSWMFGPMIGRPEEPRTTELFDTFLENMEFVEKGGVLVIAKVGSKTQRDLALTYYRRALEDGKNMQRRAPQWMTKVPVLQ